MERIGQEEIRAVCRRILVPEQFVLIALGDFPPEDPPSLELADLG
jgi:hypothetical protein